MNQVLLYKTRRLILTLERACGLVGRDRFRYEKIKIKDKYTRPGSYKKGMILSKRGLSISTDLSGFHALSQVGRDIIDGLKKTSIPFDVFDTNLTHQRNDQPDLGGRYRKFCTPFLKYKTKICLTTSEGYFEPEYNNFITPFWEFESGMMEARPHLFDGVSGVIAFSDFCYDYFKKVAPVHLPIYKVKYPFHPNWIITQIQQKVRTKYHLKKNEFCVFFHFDYNSCYERKNPEAVLKAFALAFKKTPNARLVIKTNGFDAHQDKVTLLKNVAKNLGITKQVLFLNKQLDRNALMSLINAMDVYISLHRGEGLGMGMLEAMALGKPVVATNYGGNTEFMNKDNSLLVDYSWMRPKNLDYKAYKAVEKWADPDIDQAAKYLKKLYINRAFSKELGEKAKNFIKTYFNLKDFEQDIKRILLINSKIMAHIEPGVCNDKKN